MRPSSKWVSSLFLIVGVTWAHAAEPKPKNIAVQFALYFAPSPSAEPETKLNEALASISNPEPAECKTTFKWLPLEDYAPPSPASFRYVAKDLTEESGAKIAESERVFVVTFQGPSAVRNALNKYAAAVIAQVAESTSGIPWDEESRVLYSAADWRKRKVDSWESDLPDVRAQINMHAYRNPDLVRVITLGMKKFGLPDLVLDDIPSGNSRSAGNVVNACAQLLLEGAWPVAGKLDVKLNSIRHKAVREYELTNPASGAKSELRVKFAVAAAEEGDPDNALWRIEFPDASGSSQTEKAIDAFATLYGSTDKIIQPTDRNAVAVASEKARREFFEKVPQWRKGFEPNERLMVKKGFKVEGGTEYMWVEVVGWENQAVKGILANDSYYDKSLRDGARVIVKFDEVYDYIHYKSDGSEEGNETSKVLEAQQK